MADEHDFSGTAASRQVHIFHDLVTHFVFLGFPRSKKVARLILSLDTASLAATVPVLAFEAHAVTLQVVSVESRHSDLHEPPFLDFASKGDENDILVEIGAEHEGIVWICYQSADAGMERSLRQCHLLPRYLCNSWNEVR